VRGVVCVCVHARCVAVRGVACVCVRARALLCCALMLLPAVSEFGPCAVR